mgnify:CR=1 FL=1
MTLLNQRQQQYIFSFAICSVCFFLHKLLLPQTKSSNRIKKFRKEEFRITKLQKRKLQTSDQTLIARPQCRWSIGRCAKLTCTPAHKVNPPHNPKANQSLVQQTTETNTIILVTICTGLGHLCQYHPHRTAVLQQCRGEGGRGQCTGS